MRKYINLIAAAILACVCVSVPLVVTSCSTPPDSRVAAVQTLKAVGQSAEASVQLAGQLYQAGQLTQAQLLAVAEFYDGTFQPAFRAAVIAARADVTALAPADVALLATQLATLVASYTAR